ncbi:MAG: phage tail protein [Deltaproteobacteria bacterium]|jgi:hypothetical protein|nr:phage tail protein [Deltaproteobacteria bacterium]MBW2536184.1 phage tail protein [Deltaproteobacteria bacterium]
MARGTRRSFLKVAVAGAAATALPDILLGDEEDGLLGRLAHAGKAQTIAANRFRVEVKGVYGSVAGVTAIDVGRVDIQKVKTTQGDKPDYVSWTYGSHTYAPLTLRLQMGPGNVKIQKWADKAMKIGGSGDALRRDISVFLLAKDQSTVLGTLNAFGCYPTSLSGSGSDQTLKCHIDRIEEAVSTKPPGSAGRCASKLLRVSINGQPVPVQSFRVGSQTNLASVTAPAQIRLVNCMAPYDKVLAQAADQAGNKGLNERFTITAKQLDKKGKVTATRVFDNCLITSLDWPVLGPSQKGAPVRIATFWPERVETG